MEDAERSGDPGPGEPHDTYGNTDWKDLLTAFDGQSITYDTSGNPLSYYNGKRLWGPRKDESLRGKEEQGSGRKFPWKGRRSGADFAPTRWNGRELDSLTVGGKRTSYQYDVNGLRTKKTNPDGRDRQKSPKRKNQNEVQRSGFGLERSRDGADKNSRTGVRKFAVA